jgi:hypothetical protein
MGRACSTHGGEEEWMQGIGGKATKRPLGTLLCRWKDSIKMDLIGWGGMDWISLA